VVQRDHADSCVRRSLHQTPILPRLRQHHSSDVFNLLAITVRTGRAVDGARVPSTASWHHEAPPSRSTLRTTPRMSRSSSGLQCRPDSEMNATSQSLTTSNRLLLPIGNPVRRDQGYAIAVLLKGSTIPGRHRSRMSKLFALSRVALHDAIRKGSSSSCQKKCNST
jgi:hypothetical protein